MIFVSAFIHLSVSFSERNMSGDEEDNFCMPPEDMNAIAEVISSAIAGVGGDAEDVELELFKLLLTDVCTPFVL